MLPEQLAARLGLSRLGLWVRGGAALLWPSLRLAPSGSGGEEARLLSSLCHRGVLRPVLTFSAGLRGSTQAGLLPGSAHLF